MATDKLDIDTVKRKTGITDEQLEGEIKEDKLWELAGLLGNHKPFVRLPGFGLLEATIADLNAYATENDHQHATREALIKWRNVTRAFTYRSLVDILIELNKGNIAVQVCKTVVGKRASCIKRKTLPSEKVSGQVRSDEGIAGEVKSFEQRFMDLRKATHNKLKECKVSIKEFQQALIIQPSTISNSNENFVVSKLSLFEKAESIDTIFTHLSFYLSYINFDLLDHIIKQFGSDSLKEDMRCYAKDMKEFKAKTTIRDALKYLPKPKSVEQTNPPANFTLLKTKFKVDINVATLEKLDEYGKLHANELSLSHLAFFLFEFEESCLLVTWLVPTSLEIALYKVMQVKSPSYFISNNIFELSLGKNQLYTTKSSDLSPSLVHKHSEAEVFSKAVSTKTVPYKDTRVTKDNIQTKNKYTKLSDERVCSAEQIQRPKYSTGSCKRQFSHERDSYSVIESGYQLVTEVVPTKVDIQTNSELTELFDERVCLAEHVRRPIDSNGVRGLFYHEGVRVTTESGHKWLVHKGDGYGRTSQTVVTDSRHMSDKWTETGRVSEVTGHTIGDFVKAGGEYYNMFTDNCWDGADRMMKLGEDEDTGTPEFFSFIWDKLTSFL